MSVNCLFNLCWEAYIFYIIFYYHYTIIILDNVIYFWKYKYLIFSVLLIFVNYECKLCMQFTQKIHEKYIFILGIKYTQFIPKSTIIIIIIILF